MGSGGGPGNFDDRYGPTVLAGAMLAAVVVNFALRFVDAGAAGKGGS